ncbi:MAG: hypothetical protein C0505_17240 [Leptothrix sp. (in: Bacteria)]|nr:hypothetical protein [Leptothrix sp. (in: b-proteobacteria)]
MAAVGEPSNHSGVGDDFSSLFEFLPIGAYRTAPNGLLLRSNPALVGMNGFASEAEQLAVLNASLDDWYVQPGRRQEFRRLLERDGQVVGFESEVRRFCDGHALWVRENAHVVRDAAGRVQYYEGTVEEITERVQARQAAQRSAAQLEQLLALVPGAVYRVVMDADGRRRCTFMSEGVRGLYGIEPAAVLADVDALGRFRHPEDAAQIEATVQTARASESALKGEARVRLDDGTEKWVQVVSRPAPPEDGERVRVGILVDITAQKRVEQALRDNGELWKRALECSGDGVWDWDLDRGAVTLSPRLEALYGYGADDLADDPAALDALTHPADVAAMLQAREDHLAGRVPTYVNEHRVRCKDGQWKWILTRGIVIARDAQGRPRRMIGTHTDITAFKLAEALRVERDRAAAANLAKSQFLSRVSHELRTPLNAVLGFAQLLELEPGDGERQRLWVTHVLSSGRHLLALMDDVLDISSAQTGQLPMAIESLPLQPLVVEVLAMLSSTAAGAAVTVHDDTGQGPPLHLRADRKRLLQVLSNLLSNAIKYNRAGGWVRLRAEAAADGVIVSVADSGPGLDAEQRARLFEPFQRVGAQHGAVPGTGLGLALSRQLVEAMGGTLTVESEPGKGAVFRLQLPAA